jgi:hypothetical protein
MIRIWYSGDTPSKDIAAPTAMHSRIDLVCRPFFREPVIAPAVLVCDRRHHRRYSYRVALYPKSSLQDQLLNMTDAHGHPQTLGVPVSSLRCGLHRFCRLTLFRSALWMLNTFDVQPKRVDLGLEHSREGVTVIGETLNFEIVLSLC